MTIPRTLAFLCALAIAHTAAAGDFSALDRVNYTAVRGDVGVGVLDLQTGRHWYRQADKAFPMQSVYKMPIAIAVLRRVDQGHLALDQKVRLGRHDIAPAWSPITKAFSGESMDTTVGELIEYAVGLSDNTAADVLMGLLGGAKQVNRVLTDVGVRGVRIDRLEKELQTESVGLPRFTPELADDGVYTRAVADLPSKVRRAALLRYLKDPRDTSSPRAMVQLMARLAQGELLSPSSTAFLLRVMTDSPTGPKRLKAGLPAGWSLAHKTGTGADVLGRNTATNDAGLVTAPDGKRFALAVFIAGSRVSIDKREALMADIAAALARSVE